MTAQATGRDVWTAVATGIGSWPGTDPREAASIVVGELPALPHLVELPARGLGADMLGRVSALLVDLHLDASTTGYRLVSHRGTVAARAEDLLARDLDALEEAWERAGPESDRPVKVQAAGPLTLAAHLELATGRRVLTDRGAVRDVSESLAEGIARHAAEITRRLGVRVVVQLDEPALPDVLAGRLTGRTALETVPALPGPEALDILDTTIRGTGASVAVHCCADDLPTDLLRRSAADAVAFDVSRIRRADLDGLGELIDSGTVPILGLVRASASAGWREQAAPAVDLIDRLGFPRGLLRSVGVAPACGLASVSDEAARTALRLTREIAAVFADEPEHL
ncbi:methionine synthase [Rhodococcus sp. Z13]|uniref:Methionine synthase n=1 Tax=Rhodococcus sacchari TaxID=2962047 RepID=A0ACD4DC87_9NOCA|nr:methionine synthase [Rhodococcus sp. Z13]UYP17646.1 methionine synthase [Rhodococcus sp. Z13]